MVHMLWPGIRLFQEGAQNIVGFSFSASLTMDMEEVGTEEDRRFFQKKLRFSCVESQMFQEFEGEWRIQPHSRRKDPNSDRRLYSTKIFYTVNITPKGLVPAAALEWRIKEDVPLNLMAVKAAVEKQFKE